MAVGALAGAAGVALGAFAAHGLASALANLGYAGDDLARRMANFDTAVRYQLVHAIALVLVGLVLRQQPSRAGQAAGWLFAAGLLLFSGLLYLLAIAGPNWKWLGAVVPFGGGALIAGWLALAIAALRG
jgi:uncharacterized membrane protein YgdD (TMEM256/DUF423 family)